MRKPMCIAFVASMLVVYDGSSAWSQSSPEAMTPLISAPVSTILGAVIGLVGGFIIAEINRRQKADELFFKALDFLKGGSQQRNLGLSAIELYWRQDRHRPLCVSLLSGTAVYLLRESEQGAATHELFNLERIMHFLTEQPFVSTERMAYRHVLESLREKCSGTPGGLKVDRDKLETWSDKLTKRT